MSNSIAPSECKEKDLCRISRDTFSVGDFSIMTDSYRVWITEHKMGEEQKQAIEIPPRVFVRLAKWYFEPQEIK